MLLPAIFGRFYYALMNELTHPFIKSTPHTRGITKILCEWPICQKISHMGSVDSAKQNRDFNCCITDPVKPKLETKWRSGKQQFILSQVSFALSQVSVSIFC